MKKSTKILLTTIGVVLAAAGAVALINPEGASALLVYIVGVAVLLSGVATIATALLPEFAQRRKVLIGLAASDIVLGVLILLFCEYYIMLLGIGVVLLGISLTVVSLQRKKHGVHWLDSMCAAVVAIALGIALIFFFKEIQAAIGVILGIALLAAGIILVIVGLSSSSQKG